METVLLCIAIIISIFTSILMGIDIGKKIATKDSEPISVPFFNPIQKIKEHKIQKEQDKETEEFNKLMQNIDNYDGSEIGQQEVNIE